MLPDLSRRRRRWPFTVGGWTARRQPARGQQGFYLEIAREPGGLQQSHQVAARTLQAEPAPLLAQVSRRHDERGEPAAVDEGDAGQVHHDRVALLAGSEVNRLTHYPGVMEIDVAAQRN